MCCKCGILGNCLNCGQVASILLIFDYVNGKMLRFAPNLVRTRSTELDFWIDAGDKSRKWPI